MRFTERNTLADHPFSQIGSQRKPARSQLAHAVLMKRQRRYKTGHRRQQQVKLCHRVNDWLLVFLQVTIIGQRLSLQRGQKPSEIANKAASLAAGKFRHVRILLLRHDGRTRRPSIIKRDIAIFRCAPIDDFFREPGHIHRDLRQNEGSLGGEVTSRSAVQGVFSSGVEP